MNCENCIRLRQRIDFQAQTIRNLQKQISEMRPAWYRQLAGLTVDAISDIHIQERETKRRSDA